MFFPLVGPWTVVGQFMVDPDESAIDVPYRGRPGAPANAGGRQALRQVRVLLFAVWGLPGTGHGRRPLVRPPNRKENLMRSTRLPTLAAAIALATLAGCAGMTPREHSTAVGAGVGAAAGAVLTGTATGGVVGNQIKR